MHKLNAQYSRQPHVETTPPADCATGVSRSKDGFDELGEGVAGETGGEQQQRQLTPAVPGEFLHGARAAGRFGATPMRDEGEAQGQVADE